MGGAGTSTVSTKKPLGVLLAACCLQQRHTDDCQHVLSHYIKLVRTMHDSVQWGVIAVICRTQMAHVAKLPGQSCQCQIQHDARQLLTQFKLLRVQYQ